MLHVRQVRVVCVGEMASFLREKEGGVTSKYVSPSLFFRAAEPEA